MAAPQQPPPVIPPQPLPPLPPTPTPPPLPNNFMKQLPLYLKLFGLSVAAFSTFIQTEVLPNSEFLALYPNAANIPGICGMIVGVIAVLIGTPVANWNMQKVEDNLKHKDDVIQQKDLTIVQKTQEVDIAECHPSRVPDGVDPVRHRLNHAIVEAVNLDRVDDAGLILAIIPRLLKGGAK